MSDRALDLRGVHDAADDALNHARSARVLTRDDDLGVAHLDAAIAVLAELVAALRWYGLPA